MNGIQQIGFSNTISSADTNDTFRKLIGLVKIIFELED